MLPQIMRVEYEEILNPPLCSYESKLLKGADKLAAYIKCLEELKGGNSEFNSALASTKKILEEIDLPEVKYFLENFIEGFTLSLDELD